MRRLCLIALLLTGLAPQLRAANVYGDIRIDLDPEPRGNNAHGYTEYTFKIQNSGDRPRVVGLAMPNDTRGSGSGTIASVTRRTEVPAKRTAIVSLLYPARPQIVGRDVTVYIDGAKKSDTIPLVPMSGSMHHGGGHRGMGRFAARPAIARGFGGGAVGDTLVFYTQSIEEKFFQVAGPGGLPRGGRLVPAAGVPAGGAEEPGGGGPPLPPGAGGPAGGMMIEEPPALTGHLHRAGVPVSAWSDNWLAYSRYDGVIVTPRDIHELAVSSEGTRRILRALWRYAETGGVLVVVGGGKPPLPKAWENGRPAARAGWSAYQVGFGQCYRIAEASAEKWTRDDWAALQGAFNVTNTPWLASRPLRDLHDSFPVVDSLGVPVRGLFALMVVFAVAIGPLNLMFLTKRKKRLWMLWTVPLISALTCASVFGYMLVAEGWSGHARVAGLTLLDQVEERATTLGRAAFYSPMTPGDGLHFSDDVEVMANGAEHTTDENTCTIDWLSGEQHLRRGWVTARVPAHFTLRRSEVQGKYRLTIHREKDGRLVVVNALGADIKELHLADEKGGVYHHGAVPAGQEATLERKGNEVAKADPTEAWRRLYGNTDWGMFRHSTSIKAEDVLVPRTYLAVIEQTPFLEQGLRGATPRPAQSVVLGVFGEIGNK